MTVDLLSALGGIGLFILGMIVLTDGLRALAGDALNRFLLRFTRSPASGAASGALLTALVQSSTATTVAMVGFVSAELMTFPQALGVVLGANVGTTATGWLVALLGFRLELGRLMLPVLFAGVLARLFGRGRLRSAGWAAAGFAVIFLGIAEMRAGMASLQGVVTPETFPPDTWGGRLLLVAIGIGVTVVTQSSSAGVAAALSAVAAGAISFPQAAAVVIGMDVGTTSSAAIAAVGGSAPTRRTGYAHVVYNLLTGVVGLLLLDPYTHAVGAWVAGGVGSNASLALVGFHTTINVVGLALALPFTGALARLMLLLVPERRAALTSGLEERLLGDPGAASTALLGSVRAVTAAAFAVLARALAPGPKAGLDPVRLGAVDRAVEQARRFADRIRPSPADPEPRRRLLAAMHGLDHLDRLVERCRKVERLETLRAEPRLRQLAAALRRALEPAAGAPEALEGGLRAMRARIRGEREPYRATMLAEVPAGLPLDEAIRRLDALRWLHRTTYHAWRIAHNLALAGAPARAGADVAPRPEHDPED